MAVSEAEVRQALRSVKFPGLGRDIVSFGFVREVTVDGDRVRVAVHMTTANPDAAAAVERHAREVLEALPGVAAVELRVETSAPGTQDSKPEPSRLLPGVRRVVAVASGKGGVGKSTVAANLAISLHRLGLAVGLLDADIYGPSQHVMMGCRERPYLDESGRILPLESHGVRLMSLGFLIDPDQPVIWRGPMVMKALQQLLEEVAWGDLDVLVVDLPPGTGDAQLTLTQQVPLSGAVIVTTPQDVALADARKGLAMFRTMDVPVLGVVENMSAYVCPACGHREPIFKEGGGRRTAAELGAPFLGEVPVDPAVVVSGDAGTPIVAASPQTPAARALTEAASRIARALGLHPAATPASTARSSTSS